MKNFNFALLLAIYIFAVGWLFVRTQQLEIVGAFAIAVSPLAVAAFYSGGFRFRQELDRKTSNAFLAQFLALAGAFFFIRFVVLYVAPESTLEFADLGSPEPLPVFGYYWPLWPEARALEFFGINVLFAASALTIWSSYCFGADRPGDSRRAMAAYFAGVSEPVRFLVYAYILITAYSIGALAVAVIWKEFSVADMLVIMGRASVTLVVPLVVALLRLRVMGPAMLLSAGGTAYLVILNTTVGAGIVSVAAALAALAALLGARWILAGGGEAQSQQATAAAPEKADSVEAES